MGHIFHSFPQHHYFPHFIAVILHMPYPITRDSKIPEVRDHFLGVFVPSPGPKIDILISICKSNEQNHQSGNYSFITIFTHKSHLDGITNEQIPLYLQIV